MKRESPAWFWEASWLVFLFFSETSGLLSRQTAGQQGTGEVGGMKETAIDFQQGQGLMRSNANRVDKEPSLKLSSQNENTRFGTQKAFLFAKMRTHYQRHTVTETAACAGSWGSSVFFDDAATIGSL